jgi:S1-C subfamily serine protease
MALTRHDGRFTLKSVPAGTVTLHAYAPTLGRGTSSPVEVIAGREVRDTTIRLASSSADELPTGQSANVAITLLEQSGSISVASVAPGSEAERAGIVVGDVLVAVEGVRPESLGDARSRLAGADGTDVLLEFLRAGSPFRLRLSREPVRR